MSGQSFLRLKQAIEVIALKQLKQNHDDTLTEKLITHVKTVITRRELSHVETDELLQFVMLLPDRQETPDPVSLQLLAILISSDYFSSEQSEDAIEKFCSICESVTVSSDLSLQSALIKSLRLLVVTGPFSDFCSASCYISFPKILYDMATESRSYFARNEAEKLLVTFFTEDRFLELFDDPDECTHLTEILEMISTDPSVSNLQLLKLILEQTGGRNIMNKFNLREAMFRHFETFSQTEFPSTEVLHLFCHVLGMTVMQPVCVEKVFATCLRLNDLKALVIYSSRLLQIDREYANKWLLYSLYSLVARMDKRSEVGEQMLASMREKSFVERHTNTGVVMTVLRMMPLAFENVDDNAALVVETLHIFLQTHLKEKKKLLSNRKIISEAISCLAKCRREDLVVENDFNEIICDLIQLSESHTDDHLIELLIVERDFWKERESFDVYHLCDVGPVLDCMTRILSGSRFHQPIRHWTESEDVCEKDVEIMELVLDVVSKLRGADVQVFFTQHDKFLQVFTSLWHMHRHNDSFLTSAIPLLFEVDLRSTDETLTKFGFARHVNIPDIITEALIRGNDLLTTKIMCLLKEYSSRHVFRMLTSVYERIVSALTYTVLMALDSETQLIVLNFIQEKYSPRPPYSFDDIQRMYESGVMTAAMQIVQSDLFSSDDVRVTAFEITEQIRDCIRHLKITEAEL